MVGFGGGSPTLTDLAKRISLDPKGMVHFKAVGDPNAQASTNGGGLDVDALKSLLARIRVSKEGVNSSMDGGSNARNKGREISTN